MPSNVSSSKMLPSRELETRVRLLKSAIVAFSEFGYEGASLRTIAEDAGVSFQLITYHFGSKDELWTAAVDEAYRRYAESGRSLGFDLSGDLREQFRNHLQLLLTMSLGNPHLRKILTQERLARSDRYSRVLKPKLIEMMHILAFPYFEQVVKLGIISRVSPRQLQLLWRSLVAANIIMPDEIELCIGLPAGSAESIEAQVDLVFSLMTQGTGPDLLADSKPSAQGKTEKPSRRKPGKASDKERTHVWGEQYSALPASQLQRLSQLEIENEHLKRMVGELTLQARMRPSGKAEKAK